MKKYVAMCGALAVVAWTGCAAMASSALADSPPVGVVTVGPAQDVSGTQPAVPTPARPAGVFINRPTMAMEACARGVALRLAQVTVGVLPERPSAATVGLRIPGVGARGSR